ncbi:ferritin [Ruegeria arenilitoris]|uniref:ferritin n=1 Tax=Ruegeria arenilitoris TaxID=1173585 RepID=UPI001479DF96|nr:ferritin [Ruegeria arenilitoris]
MKLNPNVAEALNRQINSELQASYTYLAMAAYFESQDLPGFAQWFRGHSVEEQTHAMRIFDFVAQRGGRIELEGIDTPKMDYDSPVEALEYALANEEKVTGQINALFELAHGVKEYSTQNMLNWFLAEQNEEEDLFGKILYKTKAANGDRWNLLLLDKDMGTRPTQATE